MAINEKIIKEFACNKCGHKWFKRLKQSYPRICPKCKTHKWNQ